MRKTVGDRADLPPEPIEERTPQVELPIPFEKPLDKRQTAMILGISISGLDKLISTHKSPPFFRAGRQIRFRPSMLKAWMADQEKPA